MSRVACLTTILLGLTLLGVNMPTVVAAEPADAPALDKAFETLKTYDWGNDRSALQALDDAVAAAHGDAAARKTLETRLVAVVSGEVPARPRMWLAGT